MMMPIILHGGLRLMTLTADKLYRLHRLWTASPPAVDLGVADASADNSDKTEIDVNRTET